MMEQHREPEDFVDGGDSEQFLRLLWDSKEDVGGLADFTNLLNIEEDSLYTAQMCVIREATFFEELIHNFNQTLQQPLEFNFKNITSCVEVVFDAPMEMIFVAENQQFYFAFWWSTTV